MNSYNFNSLTPQTLTNMDLPNLYRMTRVVTQLYPHNTLRKNYFLAACKCWDETIALDEVDILAPYGGTIGIGDSFLDKLFRSFKIFCLHAIYMTQLVLSVIG